MQLSSTYQLPCLLLSAASGTIPSTLCSLNPDLFHNFGSGRGSFMEAPCPWHRLYTVVGEHGGGPAWTRPA